MKSILLLFCFPFTSLAFADELATTKGLVGAISGTEKESQKLISQISGLYCTKSKVRPYGEPDGKDSVVSNALFIQATKDPAAIRFEFDYNLIYQGDNCVGEGYAIYTGNNTLTHAHKNDAEEGKPCRIFFKVDKKTITIDGGEGCSADICQTKEGSFAGGEFLRNKKANVKPVLSISQCEKK